MTEPFSDRVRDALLAALFHAGSDFVADRAAGRLRLARPDQHPVDGRGRELDVAAALGGGAADEGAAGGRAGGVPA